MKIAIFGPSKHFLSGVSYYTINLSNALAEFVDVKAVLFHNMLPKRLFPGWKRIGKELSQLEFDGKVEVYEVLDWYNPLTWIKAHRIVRRSDIMIFQWWTSSVAHMYLAIEFLNRTKKPVVIEFHEIVDPLEDSILPLRIYSRITGKLIRKLASYYVVHSNADKELISTIYKIPREKISIIPHGIYNHYEKISNAKRLIGIDEEFVILFFGLLRPYKGIKYLIKAFEMLPEDLLNKSRLLIVGETWEDEESVKLAENSTCFNKITIIDRYVPDEEVSLYFSASDLVVLPYTRASQSGVAHIAMSFGLPIISTKVGGLEESLSDYRGTYFVEAENAESIADAIQKIYEKHKTYKQPERLKWENIARKWTNLLKMLNK